jgi:hypothetical protein
MVDQTILGNHIPTFLEIQLRRIMWKSNLGNLGIKSNKLQIFNTLPQAEAKMSYMPSLYKAECGTLVKTPFLKTSTSCSIVFT